MSNGHAAGHGDGDAHPSTSSDAGSDALPLLSPSIIGVEPLDEFIREIADFIHYHISQRPQEPGGVIEVEAKIGVLRDLAGGQRLQLPVLVESILAPHSVEVRFESNMSARQHQHYNILLNKLKVEKPELNINYEHLHLIDNFYSPESGRGEKIRVTRDEKTSQVRACVRKVRLGDLNIFCPKRLVDWRVSVNMEIPVPPPIGSPTHTRKKDRLSYTHQEFAIDLTQVTATFGPNSKPEILHELEVELRHSDYLLMVAAKRGLPEYTAAEQNAFDELIHAFVNNARILCRNANPASGGGDTR
ncbi:mRNA triphosphatase CET1 [Lentinus tigrinus ALCF2SS1-6]|uniref:mRNA-capping enzyme subunit beta n=1 Tax=Lentinus tigrinus ALCF2SS1-6 TaxID=1328759 RepID=A0A5C2SHW7_9APHY|nr:mRNA triphosphatase CET1 [Lentinus tigrinus ALCF2SS1-6]